MRWKRKTHEVRETAWEQKPGQVRTMVTINAGHRGTERVVPPAGEAWAFERDVWDREVGVYVSPTGRSVRVFVDGVEIGKGGVPC